MPLGMVDWNKKVIITRKDMKEDKTDKKKKTGAEPPEEKQVTREEDAAMELEKMSLDRKTYRALKRDLIGAEEENFGEIVMLKCSGNGDWFEVAEHSALMYYYLICQPLKVKNLNFENDYDSFFEQFRIGRIRTRGTATVRSRIQQAGYYSNEFVMTGKLIFVLKKPISRDKMESLKKREAKRRLDLNKTIEIKHADPLFYRNLAEMIHWLHINCSSKMEKLNSQTNGARMVTLADGIMAKYLHSTDLPDGSKEGRKEDWIQIRKMVYKLKYEVQIVDIAKIWTPEVCVKLFEQVGELLRLANANLSKMLKGEDETSASGNS